MASSKIRIAGSWVLAVLLGAAYVMAGLGKFSGGAGEMFVGWGYPAWFAVVIGTIEVSGGAALLVPRFTRIGVLGLSIIMIGASVTHLVNGEGFATLRPVVFLALLWALRWLRARRQHGDTPEQLASTTPEGRHA